MVPDTSISDDILQQAQDAIDHALAEINLTPDRRAVLEVQNYFLMFLRSDHKKIRDVYAFYLAERDKRRKESDTAKWTQRTVIGAALAAIVMLFINGLLFLASTHPIIQAILKGKP